MKGPIMDQCQPPGISIGDAQYQRSWLVIKKHQTGNVPWKAAGSTLQVKSGGT